MSTIKNSQMLLYCHFNKIIKEPGTSFQSPELVSSPQHSAKNMSEIFVIQHTYLTKFHFDRKDSKEISMCDLHYAAMLMMTPQILKSVGFTKTQNLDISRKHYFFSK